MTATAPIGTVIRCSECDAATAELTAPISRGGVIEAAKVKRLDGATSVPGERVICPVDGRHIGFYALVDGERWRVT